MSCFVPNPKIFGLFQQQIKRKAFNLSVRKAGTSKYMTFFPEKVQHRSSTEPLYLIIKRVEN